MYTISSILQLIDCTKPESKTFIALLNEAKGASVLKLSKKINSPRTTIYGHLNSLIKKGIAKKAIGEQGTTFFAEDLDNILNVYNEKIDQIKIAKQDLADQVKSLKVETNYQPKFIFYNNPEAAQSIFRDILRSREKLTYWFWPLKEMMTVIPPETFHSFNTERVRREMEINILWPPQKKVDIKKYSFLGDWDSKKSLRNIKLLPTNIDQNSGYIIYGTKVAFISSNKENYGFIIDSKELVDSFKSQFDYFWKISKPVKFSS